MNQVFFITGLPRSRTAWLAAFLNEPGLACFHDLLADCHGIDEIGPRLDASGMDIAGDSDSGLLLYASSLVKMFPDAKWLHVLRPFHAALESYRVAFMHEEPYKNSPAYTWQEMNESFERLDDAAHDLKDIVHRRNYHMIEYGDLRSHGCLELEYRWLFPGRPFPTHRWNVMHDLRVTLIPGRRVNNFVRGESEVNKQLSADAPS